MLLQSTMVKKFRRTICSTLSCCMRRRPMSRMPFDLKNYSPSRSGSNSKKGQAKAVFNLDGRRARQEAKEEVAVRALIRPALV